MSDEVLTFRITFTFPDGAKGIIDRATSHEAWQELMRSCPGVVVTEQKYVFTKVASANAFFLRPNP